MYLFLKIRVPSDLRSTEEHDPMGANDWWRHFQSCPHIINYFRLQLITFQPLWTARNQEASSWSSWRISNSGRGNPRATCQFSKRFTQVFVERAMFSFLFFSTSRSHSLRSSSDYRRGLLAVCICSSPMNSKREGLSSSASETPQHSPLLLVLAITLFYSTVAIYKTVTRRFVRTDQSANYFTFAHFSANQRAITILHCWQSVVQPIKLLHFCTLVQPISELLHLFALFT